MGNQVISVAGSNRPLYYGWNGHASCPSLGPPLSLSDSAMPADADAFEKLIHALFGVYLYEFFITLPFDWDFITRKKPFRWPMIFYFGNRYLLLFSMIGIIIGLDARSKLNCRALFTFNQIAGNAAIGLASINLSVRTIAVWSQNKWVAGGLILIILGHWSLILRGFLVTADWVPGVGCVITATDNRILAAIFIYSMCFDFVVLMLNLWKLLGIGSNSGRSLLKSKIGQIIFEDGLIFFIIAFLINLIATVFMLLNLNPIMTVIFNVPAAVFSTMAACRAVRRLTNFTSSVPDVYAFSTSQILSTRAAPESRSVSKPGIRVQAPYSIEMEATTHQDDTVSETSIGHKTHGA